MTSNNTGRFQWPIPPWNADWQKWQQDFGNFADGVDAAVFALLEHLTLIHHTLPVVEIVGVNFTQTAAAVFLSRTMETQISVGPNVVALVPGALIGASIQPGAVGAQAVDWEQYISQTDIDTSVIIMGIVNADYSITWFNAMRLAVGVPTTLFAASPGTVSTLLTGAGNPNGVVTAGAGTPYRDTATGSIYLNIDGATAWTVL